MANKNTALAIAAAALGGVFLWLLHGRPKQPSVPGGNAPAEPETSGGTAEEPPPEQPIGPAMVGQDLLPRYTTAMVATSRGAQLFTKDYDKATDSIRWIDFDDPGAYGSYRDITTLTTNHPPLQIYTSAGVMLWQNGQYTPAGVEFFGLVGPYEPISAMKG